MFYKHDSTRITLREFAFEGKPFHVLVAMLGKIFRFRLSSSTDDIPVDSLAPFELAEEAVPEAIRTAFEPLRRELESLGFHLPIFHAVSHQLSFTQYYSATFAHRSGEVFARIHYRHWTGVNPPRVYLFPIFATAYTDGSWLVSTAG